MSSKGNPMTEQFTTENFEKAAELIETLFQNSNNNDVAPESIIAAIKVGLGLQAEAQQNGADQTEKLPFITQCAIVYKFDEQPFDFYNRLIDPDIDKKITDRFAPYWSVEVYEPAHSMQIIMISRPSQHDRETEAKIAEAVCIEIRSMIEPYMPDDIINKGRVDSDFFVYSTLDPIDALHVDFLYHDNQQVCTATTHQDQWDVFTKDLSDEEVMLCIAGDIEILPEYDRNDITVIQTYKN